MESLPAEIVTCILFSLDPKSITRLKQVKRYFQWFIDNLFWQRYIRSFRPDYVFSPDFKIYSYQVEGYLGGIFKVECIRGGNGFWFRETHTNTEIIRGIILAIKCCYEVDFPRSQIMVMWPYGVLHLNQENFRFIEDLFVSPEEAKIIINTSKEKLYLREISSDLRKGFIEAINKLHIDATFVN